MLPILAFGFTGLLLGLLVSLSADQLSKIVIPLLFALFGGSIVAFGKDLQAAARREAYLSLFSLSLFATAGVLVGVLITENQWLSPKAQQNLTGAKELKSSTHFYLRGQLVDELQAIDLRVRQGQLGKADAYDEILSRLVAGTPAK